MLQNPEAEADDMIARWVQLHPKEKHIIVSSDSDFYQLISDNVQMYNGITDTTITNEGYYDGKGKLSIDKKTGQLLGAHLLSSEAAETINLFMMAMHSKLEVNTLKGMVFSYPSWANDIKSML